MYSCNIWGNSRGIMCVFVCLCAIQCIYVHLGACVYVENSGLLPN